MALIEWDASTQRDRIDPEVRRRAASQGLSAAQMWLHLSEFERVDGVKGAPRSEVQPRDQGGEPSAASWTPPSCGHRYPDVLRLRDEVRADGTFVRMTDCRHCGRAEMPFPASLLAEEVRLELEATGSLAGIAEKEIEAVRQREERRRHRRESFLLPTRSIGHRLALHHVAPHVAQAKRSHHNRTSHAHPVQAQPLQRAQTVCRPDNQAPLCPV